MEPEDPGILMKFNPNGPLMQFLTKIANLMILNILFLLCCIPVVTIGASWTALFYVAMKMVDDRQGSITKDFFHAFRQNLRQATILWFGVVALTALLYVDFRILAGLQTPGASVIRILLYVLSAIFFMILQYLFPWLAKFETTTRDAVKNSALAAIGNLPKTILMCIFAIIPVRFTLINDYTMLSGVFAWLMMAFALIAVADSCLLNKIFAKYIPASENKTSDAVYKENIE